MLHTGRQFFGVEIWVFRLFEVSLPYVTDFINLDLHCSFYYKYIINTFPFIIYLSMCSIKMKSRENVYESLASDADESM